LHLGADIIYGVGDVVQTFSTLFNEFGNRAIRVGGFQQFDFVGSRLEKARSHPFTLHGLLLVGRYPQQFGVKGISFF